MKDKPTIDTIIETIRKIIRAPEMSSMWKLRRIWFYLDGIEAEMKKERGENA